MKYILFLCGHNAGRSQMAEAFFNHLNTDKPNYKGISAGTNIADEVNPQAIQAMHEIGIDIGNPTQYFPKVVDYTQEYFKVFSMGCNVKCDVTADEDLGIDDPAGKPVEEVRRIRDEIKAKVQNIIQELP